MIPDSDEIKRQLGHYLPHAETDLAEIGAVVTTIPAPKPQLKDDCDGAETD